LVFGQSTEICVVSCETASLESSAAATTNGRIVQRACAESHWIHSSRLIGKAEESAPSPLDFANRHKSYNQQREFLFARRADRYD